MLSMSFLYKMSYIQSRGFMVRSSSLHSLLSYLLAFFCILSIVSVHGCTSFIHSSQDNNQPSTASATPPKQIDRRLVTLSSAAEQEAGVNFADVRMRELDSDVNVTGEVLAN